MDSDAALLGRRPLSALVAGIFFFSLVFLFSLLISLLQGDAERLAREGLKLERDRDRGYLVGRLRHIPDGGGQLRSENGLAVIRFGNVVQLNETRLLDVPFEEMTLGAVGPAQAPVAWETLPMALVQTRILALLSEDDVMQLRLVSRWFFGLCSDAVLWMALFAARFGFLPPFSAIDAAGYWMSRFFYQRREVRSFGAVPCENPNEKRMTRLVLLGPLGAGKTTLLNALQHRQFSVDPTAPVQASMFVRTSVASGYVGGSSSLCSIKFWDIPGDARNRSISSVYCKAAHCLCFVFDCDSPEQESFGLVKEWVLGLKLSVQSRSRRMVLICNKYVPERHGGVLAEARAFAKQEKLELLPLNVACDNGYEWKLFCWRLASVCSGISFIR